MGRVGAVGFMSEADVAKVRGCDGSVTDGSVILASSMPLTLSDEANCPLVATDASRAFEVVFLNILGLRISKICC
ncbi:hypothetical protein CRD_02999 [Raphidiopsis brookii D9]|nr:hypothetical protein CRD_02999 [Raphidiopsis brookii D9]